jgi:hypothetical protein
MPAQHIPSFPTRLSLEHTIIRKPDPRPHSIMAIVNLPSGFQYRGNAFFLNGSPYRGRLQLPGNFAYLRDENGVYLPMTDLEVEFGWSN